MNPLLVLLLSLVSLVAAKIPAGQILVAHPNCEVNPQCDFCTDPVNGYDSCVRVAFTYNSNSNSAREMSDGYKFWAKRVNDRNGFEDADNKRWYIELTRFNDGGDVGSVEDIYFDIANSQDPLTTFDALFGPYSSNSNLAALHAMDKIGLPALQVPLLISNSPSGHTLDIPRNFVVGVMSTGYDFMGPALHELSRSGAKTAVVIYDTTSSFSTSIFQGVVYALQEIEMIMLTARFFDSSTTVEGYEELIDELKPLNPDVFIAGTTGGQAISLITAIINRKFRPRAVVMPSAATQNVLDTFGKDSYHLLSTVQWHHDLSGPGWMDGTFGGPRAFDEDFVAEMDPTAEHASYHAASAAAAGVVLLEALEQNTSPEGLIVRTQIKENMQSQILNSFYGPLVFDEFGHNRKKSIVITQVRDTPDGIRDRDHVPVAPEEVGSIMEIAYPAKFKWGGGGMSGFGVFCLVVFLVIFTACVAGCGFKYKVEGAQGVEVIPGIDTYRRWYSKACGGNKQGYDDDNFDDDQHSSNITPDDEEEYA